jgi:hypothetical protein
MRKILIFIAVIATTVAIFQNCTGSNGGSLSLGASSTTTFPTVTPAPTVPGSTPAPTPVTPTPTPNPSGNLIKYKCPVIASSSCSNTSLCQTSCVGQYSNNATCTYYTMNAAPHSAACTAVAAPVTAISMCPVLKSNNCSDGSLCVSTCAGQYQAGAVCTEYSQNAVPTSVACTSDIGKGPVPIYNCPFIHSVNCTDGSKCPSNCLGQLSHSSTCTYYNLNAVPSTANCALLGNQSF